MKMFALFLLFALLLQKGTPQTLKCPDGSVCTYVDDGQQEECQVGLFII